MSQASNPITDLWRWDGTVGRGTYALVGFIGFAIKNNLDRFVARSFWPQPSGIFNYWAPLGKAARLDHLSPLEIRFLATLLLLSLPFIWVGVGMTVRRLRDAALPVWLVCLFFVPFVNLAFFLALCLIPSKSGETLDEAAPWPSVRPLDRVIPRGKMASAILSVCVTSVIGLVMMGVSTQVVGSYGWSLFVALPFCMGLFSVLTYSYHEPRSLASCLGVSILPIALVGLVIFAIAVEGLICLLMAAPLALPLALLGGFLGASIQAHYWNPRNRPAILTAILLTVPSAFFGEHAAALQPPEFAVRSAVEINAPPSKVWNEVVAFAEIPPPQEWLFRAGIAYPIRAEISGSGAGAIRHCIFSTGPFEEPITVWDQPHLLKFSVTQNPAPLNELSPYKQIHAPHLHGYFISHGGQFLLTGLPGGRTRLEGTTWYRHTMWPATYWGWWSDYVIHRIHMRVLNHIREQAEMRSVQAFATAADSSTR
ncbi:MAG TPA: DUF805 domain-containing protein [Candidatus Acidoferrum sp.]|jgi:uncharacterized membrane protein YhaH (DUF805 family)